MTSTAADPRFPIGEFKRPVSLNAAERKQAIDKIERAPTDLRNTVSGLSDAQLDTPYRSGGWTIRQVVHHLPDSHMNAYVRVRLALTEDHPAIKPYEEARWAELPDARSGAIEPSLKILEGLHARWVELLRSLDDAAFARTLHHPEHGTMRIDQLLAMYAWHGEHHIEHIKQANKKQ